jgi:hypothetical protein
MNATEDVGWLDSPSIIESAVERLKAAKSAGVDAGSPSLPPPLLNSHRINH